MTDNKIFDQIKVQIASNNILLYMKGTADFPQCGFSAMVVGILQTLGKKFETINILEDEELRQGIKDFSDWPTIPQLYVAGEFVGGCDIVREMYESGDLSKLIKNANSHDKATDSSEENIVVDAGH